MWNGNAKGTKNSVTVAGQALQPARKMVWLKGQYEQMNMNQWGKNKLVAGFKIPLPLNAGLVSFNLNKLHHIPFFGCNTSTVTSDLLKSRPKEPDKSPPALMVLKYFWTTFLCSCTAHSELLTHTHSFPAGISSWPPLSQPFSLVSAALITFPQVWLWAQYVLCVLPWPWRGDEPPERRRD